MPFPRKLLNDDEIVRLDLHPHWWFFVSPGLAFIGAFALFVLSVFYEWPSTAVKIILGLMAICAFWIFIRYLQWRNTYYVVTSDRLIYRAGLVAKRGIEIPLRRVNTIHPSQSIWERMLGIGDLLIESGAEDGQQRFLDIRRPNQVVNEISAAVDDYQQSHGHEDSGYRGAGTSVAEQLEKFEGLRDRGTITWEEFEIQKKRLLGD